MKQCNHGFKKEPTSGAYSDDIRIYAVLYSGLGTQVMFECRLCSKKFHEVWVTGLEVTIQYQTNDKKEYSI